MELQWRQQQVLRVERTAPRVTRTGKILHLHADRGASAGGGPGPGLRRARCRASAGWLSDQMGSGRRPGSSEPSASAGRISSPASPRLARSCAARRRSPRRFRSARPGSARRSDGLGEIARLDEVVPAELLLRLLRRGRRCSTACRGGPGRWRRSPPSRAGRRPRSARSGGAPRRAPDSRRPGRPTRRRIARRSSLLSRRPGTGTSSVPPAIRGRPRAGTDGSACPSLLLEHLVDKADHHRALADRGGDTLGRA